ncbi:uncharacterized protein LOC119170425 isoform X2 [Rhipicephalus microplus]|uniref:uncharacterized protein LOC119170425 isoform X2 n=1 Tax=Rhipicephalus microplus TaxID=6941 RepID=UPI003F6ABA9C
MTPVFFFICLAMYPAVLSDNPPDALDSDGPTVRSDDLDVEAPHGSVFGISERSESYESLRNAESAEILQWDGQTRGTRDDDDASGTWLSKFASDRLMSLGIFARVLFRMHLQLRGLKLAPFQPKTVCGKIEGKLREQIYRLTPASLSHLPQGSTRNVFAAESRLVAIMHLRQVDGRSDLYRITLRSFIVALPTLASLSQFRRALVCACAMILRRRSARFAAGVRAFRFAAQTISGVMYRSRHLPRTRPPLVCAFQRRE